MDSSLHEVLNLKDFHNRNNLFYTLSPRLLQAIFAGFRILHKDNRDLLEKGAYYEFGIFKGFGLWFAEFTSRGITTKEFKLYGFDSFEGIPETQVDVNPDWRPGGYAASVEEVVTHLENNAADLNRIQLLKGFFSKELFDQFAQKITFLPAALVVIDSDIYESCKVVLEFLNGKISPGTIILFDEYETPFFQNQQDEHGERRALGEFIEHNKSLEMKKIFVYGNGQVAFRVESV